VPRAHAHRFRHTLATEILENGGSIEDAAEVLGNSPNIIRKHYPSGQCGGRHGFPPFSTRFLARLWHTKSQSR
jgi:integrase